MGVDPIDLDSVLEISALCSVSMHWPANNLTDSRIELSKQTSMLGKVGRNNDRAIITGKACPSNIHSLSVSSSIEAVTSISLNAGILTDIIGWTSLRGSVCRLVVVVDGCYRGRTQRHPENLTSLPSKSIVAHCLWKKTFSQPSRGSPL